MAGEGGEDGFHAETAGAFEDLGLQDALALDVGHGQRAAPLIEVGHVLPWQVGGAGEELLNFFLGDAVGLPDFEPGGFLAALEQGSVDAVHGHPIDKSLPLVPFPKREAISERAVVEGEAL